MFYNNPDQIQEGDYVEYRSGPRQRSRGTVVEVHDDHVRVENEVSLHVPLILKTSITKILHRPHRANPPLSEHMAHDSLYDIEVMLASRIAQSEDPAWAFRAFVNHFTNEVAIAVARRRDSPEDSSLQPMLDDVLAVIRRYR